MTEDAEISKNDLIDYRLGLSDDMRFIYCTWLPALYHGNEWFKKIPETLFNEKYTEVLDHLFRQRTLMTRVCCLKDSPDVILAYSVSEGDRLHFIYCKQNWRGLGLSIKLMPDPFREVSHLTFVGEKILKKKYPHIIFNPFL